MYIYTHIHVNFHTYIHKYLAKTFNVQFSQHALNCQLHPLIIHLHRMCVCCRLLQSVCVAVRHYALQCVAVNVLHPLVIHLHRMCVCVLQCVAVSVLQYDAVCCSVLHSMCSILSSFVCIEYVCAAVCCSECAAVLELHPFAIRLHTTCVCVCVCCSVLRSLRHSVLQSICCILSSFVYIEYVCVLQCAAVFELHPFVIRLHRKCVCVLQCVAVCCSQCVAVRCSVLQSVCCSVLQFLNSILASCIYIGCVHVVQFVAVACCSVLQVVCSILESCIFTLNKYMQTYI